MIVRVNSFPVERSPAGRFGRIHERRKASRWTAAALCLGLAILAGGPAMRGAEAQTRAPAVGQPGPAIEQTKGAPDQASTAQTDSDEDPASTRDGLWPSDRLLRSLLYRWAERTSHRYDLNDEQKESVRAKIVERWEPFLRENRERIQPLANEFLEMRLGMEPPTKAQVQAWAEKADAVWGPLRRQLEEGSNEFREILTPAQRTKFEIDALGMQAGLSLAEQTLAQWKKGEYDERQLWTPPGDQRGAPPAGERQTSAGAEPTPGAGQDRTISPPSPPDEISIEMDAWSRYVERFTLQYRLDEAQKSSVRSVLGELKQRALDHRDRHREEIDNLERRIAEFSGGDAEMAELKSQLARLYGPVDDMFLELKQRLESVPTAGQRRAAAAEAESPTPPDSRPRP